jgi:hypothetical protein
MVHSKVSSRKCVNVSAKRKRSVSVDVCPECGKPLEEVVYIGKRNIDDMPLDSWHSLYEDGVKVWLTKDEFAKLNK